MEAAKVRHINQEAAAESIRQRAAVEASRQIRPELLARLAISFAAEVGSHPISMLPSLFERANEAGIGRIDADNMASLLTRTENACLGAAEALLGAYDKGLKG